MTSHVCAMPLHDSQCRHHVQGVCGAGGHIPPQRSWEGDVNRSPGSGHAAGRDAEGRRHAKVIHDSSARYGPCAGGHLGEREARCRGSLPPWSLWIWRRTALGTHLWRIRLSELPILRRPPSARGPWRRLSQWPTWVQRRWRPRTARRVPGSGPQWRGLWWRPGWWSPLTTLRPGHPTARSMQAGHGRVQRAAPRFPSGSAQTVEAPCRRGCRVIGSGTFRKSAIGRLLSVRRRRNPAPAAYVIHKHPGAFACHARGCQP